MDLPPFAVTFDYRCPFGRIAHEHLALALKAGAPWEVTFLPFSLDEPHVEPGEPHAWEDPAKIPSQTATLVALAVRDAQPAAFVDVHHALYTARHEQRLDVRDRDAVARVVDAAGADAHAALAEVDGGRPLAVLAEEHQRLVHDLDVFGVPTFIVGDDAAFVRLMDRPGGDADIARATIERVLTTMVGWPSLNELKHTRLPR